MNTTTTVQNRTTQSRTTSPFVTLITSWIARLWAFNKLLTLSTLFYIVLIPIYTVAAILDPRLITNAPAFIKPLKFILSSAIYTGTFLYLLTLVQGRRRWVQIAANVTALVLLLENAIITTQAIRGIPSHFNATTALDGTLFSIMGVAILVLAVFNLLLGVWLTFQRMPNPVIAWSVRLGVFITLAGMFVAVIMTDGPTPSQVAQMEAGQRPSAIGAHSIGVDDGGPGLPILGWSTEGGDVRVPHFVGLHAMQVLPLLGYLLVRRRTLSQRQQLWLVISGGAAYAGWLALLTWQALRGQSIVAMDALTLTAYAGLLGFVLISLVVGLVGLRLQPDSAPQVAIEGNG
jgi:hypothetical protein